MDKIDYKKTEKHLYLPKAPAIVRVPEMVFFAVDGAGDPNTSPDYAQALEILYGLSFTVKMSKMSGEAPEGYFEYVVPPLEGLWWTDDPDFDGRAPADKSDFRWTSLIRQPDFVDEGIFTWALERLAKKSRSWTCRKPGSSAGRRGCAPIFSMLGRMTRNPQRLTSYIPLQRKRDMPSISPIPGGTTRSTWATHGAPRRRS